MKQTLHTILLILLAQCCAGQHVFTINKGSAQYSATVSVDSCSNDNCEGKGTIKLFDKKTNQLFQTLSSEDLYFFLDSNQHPTVNIIELYDEQSPLIFDDFNFDGTEDLAIRNGNNSGYGGPSYDVYVFNKTKKQFVPSAALTSLANENLGMFQTDHKRQRLITFSKSGCCWHMTTEYAVVPQKGLQKVYELEEDAHNGETVLVTERNLVNARWTKKVKKYTTSEYYKNH